MQSQPPSDPSVDMARKPGTSGERGAPDFLALDHRLLSRLFDGLRLAIVLLDIRTTVRYSNRLADELFGAGAAGMVGRNLLAALPAEDQERLQQSVKDVLAGQAVLVRLDQFNGQEFTLTPLQEDNAVSAQHFVLCAARDRLCESGPLSGFARQYRLTRSEREILDLVVSGHSAEQIAANRGVSEATVRTHLKNTLHKTGHRTLRQLQARLGRLPPV